MEKYVKPPPLTKDELKSFFQETNTTRFCSINKNGTIHAVPVWFIYVNGKFLIGAPAKSKRVGNIRRDNRVTLLIDVEGPPTRGAMIYGKAEINNDNLNNYAVEIFKKHMPADEAVVYQRGLFKLTEWVGVHVTPEKIVSFDYGKDTTYRAATKDEL